MIPAQLIGSPGDRGRDLRSEIHQLGPGDSGNIRIPDIAAEQHGESPGQTGRYDGGGSGWINKRYQRIDIGSPGIPGSGHRF